jgi:hypothetical protein
MQRECNKLVLRTSSGLQRLSASRNDASDRCQPHVSAYLCISKPLIDCTLAVLSRHVSPTAIGSWMDSMAIDWG